ncbi:MAG TPA: GNAT family N-acetyltransferase [Candidatus Acidoferrales bacterium]|nr:GNAT family N-acetyltransferase [Candidatus Acidoferrales bacterium]
MIRVARAKDAESIAGLCAQLGYKTSSEEVELRLNEALKDGHSAVYSADFDGKILGWLQAASSQTIESGRCAEITGLVVDKAARGKGIGRSLVQQAEEWGRMMEQKNIRVRTNIKRKDAPLFYRALGFNEVKKQFVFDKSVVSLQQFNPPVGLNESLACFPCDPVLDQSCIF